MREDKRLIIGIGIGTTIASLPLLVLFLLSGGTRGMLRGAQFWAMGVLLAANLLLLLRQTIRADARKRLSAFLLLMAAATAYSLTAPVVSIQRQALILTAGLCLLTTLNVAAYCVYARRRARLE